MHQVPIDPTAYPAALETVAQLNEFKEYWKAPGKKAFAVKPRDNEELMTFGYSVRRCAIEDARRSALKSCEKRAKKSCRILVEGNELSVPTLEVKDIRLPSLSPIPNDPGLASILFYKEDIDRFNTDETGHRVLASDGIRVAYIAKGFLTLAAAREHALTGCRIFSKVSSKLPVSGKDNEGKSPTCLIVAENSDLLPKNIDFLKDNK